MKKRHHKAAAHPATKALAAVGAGAILLATSRFLLNFFGPEIAYALPDDHLPPVGSDAFLRFVSVLTNGTLHHCQPVRLKNGAEFYPAELEAIRAAQHAISLEYYEFSPGEVADHVLAALIDRVKAGVQVRMVIDSAGSFSTPDSYFDPFRAAGGQMRWYHPFHWNTWPQVNNRTHRKLLVVDGRVGFIGGAGIADHWLHATKAGPAWRDTVFRFEGGAVSGLVSTLTENWLESSGEILSGPGLFDFVETPGPVNSFVVLSTPHGGGTQARILFQTLIKSAKDTIRITTPYFLPDRSARQAMIEAVRDRGVKLQILTAGARIDHPLVRKLSHHSSWRLLKAGAEIYDYNPSMIHAKLMTVDGQWCVMGSTNFDHRSFALNDEVNLAVIDRNLVQTLDADFDEDLKQSRRLTLAALRENLIFREEEALVAPVVDRES